MAQSKMTYEQPDYRRFSCADCFPIDPKEFAHKNKNFDFGADVVPTGHEAP